MEISPANVTERKFALLTLVIGMLSISVFVSFITDMILRASISRKQRIQQKDNMRAYFALHQISTELMMRVKTYMDYSEEFKRGGPQICTDLLGSLPIDLQKSVYVEVRTPIIEGHPVFAWAGQHHAAACRELCYSGFDSTHVLTNICVFSWLDACSKMHFVESGTLRYLQGLSVKKAGCVARLSGR